jgi:hypothetical protein
MKLPRVEQAVVPQSKIVDYLLSEIHETGKYKAVFFLNFGFTIVAWEILAQALKHHAAENEVVRTGITQHGTKYVIEGMLQSPDGRNPFIRSIWTIDADSITPRFVTAYPLEE